MSATAAEMSEQMECHGCGYDLRAHPRDGKCPECGASVAEAIRLAAIPRRPAWRDSDPRWRRRMLAGAWILVLVPLMQALIAFGWATRIYVPALLELKGSSRPLVETFASNSTLCQSLLFCIGIVLLFARERGRRSAALDWTRRWGVLCSYVVLLLSFVGILFISALVLAGISALFLCMRPRYQPEMTQTLVDVSTTYLRYGPYPKPIVEIVLVAFSSVTVLLACAPLWDALRSSGNKTFARVLLVPLGLFALFHVVQAGRFWSGFLGGTWADVEPYGSYFCPQLLLAAVNGYQRVSLRVPVSTATIGVEVIKWCIMVTIATWLTIAQVAAARHRRKRE